METKDEKLKRITAEFKKKYPDIADQWELRRHNGNTRLAQRQIVFDIMLEKEYATRLPEEVTEVKLYLLGYQKNWSNLDKLLNRYNNGYRAYNSHVILNRDLDNCLINLYNRGELQKYIGIRENTQKMIELLKQQIDLYEQMDRTVLYQLCKNNGLSKEDLEQQKVGA